MLTLSVDCTCGGDVETLWLDVDALRHYSHSNGAKSNRAWSVAHTSEAKGDPGDCTETQTKHIGF